MGALIAQGDVRWADLPEPAGSGPGFRRPVVVIQCGEFNASRIATVVCVPLTPALKWADAPGNVLLNGRSTGLGRDCVANVSQVVALDRRLLENPIGALGRSDTQRLLAGIDVVLGR